MKIMNRFDYLDELREYFNDSELLEEIVHAMSDAEAKETFDYICRMWSIEIEEKEESENGDYL